MSILSSFFLSLFFCSFSSYPQLFTGYSPPWFIQNNVSSAFQRNPQTRGMISLFQSISLSLSSSLPFLLFSLPVFSVPIGFPSGYPRYQIILGENHTLSRIGLFGKLVTRLCFWTKCSLGIVSIIGLPWIRNLTSLTSVFILDVTLLMASCWIHCILFHLGMFLCKNQSWSWDQLLHLRAKRETHVSFLMIINVIFQDFPHPRLTVGSSGKRDIKS